MLALNRLMAELLSIQSICNSYETKFIVDCFTVLFQVLNICFTKCTLSTCSINTINVPAGQFYYWPSLRVAYISLGDTEVMGHC